MLMHVSKDLMWHEILKTFWFSRWTKQGPNKVKEKEMHCMVLGTAFDERQLIRVAQHGI